MDDKIGAVVCKLQQRLGDDYEVRIVDVTKNNDTVKKGISVRKNGEKIGRIYYWNGEALEAFLGDVESSPLPNIDFEMSLKKQKDNIVAILINVEANKERLKEMPHRKVEGLDLAIVYKIIFKKDSEGITSSDINNGMMAMLRVTEDELYTIAMKNTKEYYASDIKSMTETLNDMMKESQDIVEDIPETLFILSNETRQFGAICMLYPEVLKEFCEEKMIGGVFVIPSSIHEVLLMIADKNKADVGYIRRMIKEVNNENVSEVERLSDSLYYYDVATDTLRIAE